MRYTVDGKAASRKAAIAAWIARDGNDDAIVWFALAEQQSTDGYIAREAVDCTGITIRHANEEGGAP